MTNCAGTNKPRIKKINSLLFTSNQSYGMDILSSELLESDDEREDPSSKVPNEFDLSFQYSRESDTIGKNLKYSDSSLAKVLSQKESLHEIAMRKKLSNSHNDGISNIHKEVLDGSEEFLQRYNHDPKFEQPLYTTTANDYGIKKPSMATHNSKMYPKNQKFSKSFNCIMFKDQGLNTALTKSNVHGQLDPLFS